MISEVAINQLRPSNSNSSNIKDKCHHFKMACNIWLNLCIFLIGTDFWRFIPRDSLKLWSDKSVGGYRTLHTNAKSIYTIDIVVGSKNNAYIIKRIHPRQQNIICSSGSLELDQQVCVSPFFGPPYCTSASFSKT